MFRPALNLAAEEIGAMAGRSVSREDGADAEHAAAKIVRAVDNRAAGRGDDLVKATRAEIGEGGMGGVEIFDRGHWLVSPVGALSVARGAPMTVAAIALVVDPDAQAVGGRR